MHSEFIRDGLRHQLGSGKSSGMDSVINVGTEPFAAPD
jgi:hypothetical protein